MGMSHILHGQRRLVNFNCFRMTRDANGRFNDDEIAGILQDATNAYAGAFRARGTPEVLRVVEIMGILQARSWGTCSVKNLVKLTVILEILTFIQLNEFRKFMGLKRKITPRLFVLACDRDCVQRTAVSKNGTPMRIYMLVCLSMVPNTKLTRYFPERGSSPVRRH
jgi:hypothetical protein